MAIRINDIINIIYKPEPDIIQIINDYGILYQKLKGPENQSWYFKQALESNKEKLIELKKSYENQRRNFNNSNIDDLIERVNEAKTVIQSYEGGGINTATHVYLAGVHSEINYCESLIKLKKRVEKLKPIDYYVENVDEFLIIS